MLKKILNKDEIKNEPANENKQKDEEEEEKNENQVLTTVEEPSPYEEKIEMPKKQHIKQVLQNITYEEQNGFSYDHLNEFFNNFFQNNKTDFAQINPAIIHMVFLI